MDTGRKITFQKLAQGRCYAGKISHEMVRQLAEAEYEKFYIKNITKNKLSDFDNVIKLIEFTIELHAA